MTDNRRGGDKEAAGDMPVVVESRLAMPGGVPVPNRGGSNTYNIIKAGKDAAREPGGDGQDWEAANQGLNEEEGDILEVGGKFLDTGKGGT